MAEEIQVCDMNPSETSMEKYYAELEVLNPTLTNFTNLYYFDWNSEYVKNLKLNKYGGYYNSRNEISNPIFVAEYAHTKYNNGVPISIDNYRIAFAVCKDVAMQKLKFPDFYESYFVEMVTSFYEGNDHSNCDTTKNRWCIKCWKSSFISNVTKRLMKKSFSFIDMPKESILYIDKSENDIEVLTKAKDIAKEKIAAVNKIKADIDGVTAKITAIIEQQIVDTETLNKYLGDNSMDKFMEHNNAFINMHKTAITNKKKEQLLKEKAAIEEKLAKIDDDE